MNLTAFAIENRTVTYFSIVLLILGGISSFLGLGQLEDPEFTVKTAVITTPYPGASPEEVEQEVTDRIEKALQLVEEVDFITSESSAGLSMVKVEIKAEYWADRLPQIWDSVRRKINDMKGTLPPNAGAPMVNDDFGDVYGLMLAITSDGYSHGELDDYGDRLNKEIFPGIQGGPLMHVIAAKAVAFKLAMSKDFKATQRQTVANARALAQNLADAGFELVSGGTDNHLMLVDLTSLGITGAEAEKALDEAGITVNKNVIPYEKRSPFETSGVRIGTPSVTTRGMKEQEMSLIAAMIVDVLTHPKDEGVLRRVRKSVRDLCNRFPLYPEKDG